MSCINTKDKLVAIPVRAARQPNLDCCPQTRRLVQVGDFHPAMYVPSVQDGSATRCSIILVNVSCCSGLFALAK